MRQNRYPLLSPVKLSARLLDPACPRHEAAALLDRLGEGAGFQSWLHSAPYHRIGPVLSARIAALGLQPRSRKSRAVLNTLVHGAELCRLRNCLMRRQLERVVEVLGERGVTPCLFKGAASLCDRVPPGYLPPEVRAMEDLDLVVRPEDGETARELIAKRGWLSAPNKEAVPFDLDGPALVDLHVWSPLRAPLGFLSLADFFGDAPWSSVAGRAVRVLAPAKAVQVRLAHNIVHQHLFIDFPLLDLHEMAHVVSAGHDEIDWAGIRSMGLMHGVSRLIYAVLLRLRGELGAPVPEGVIPAAERRSARAALRLLEELGAVPRWLYHAASRLARISSVPGGAMDTINCACRVLVTEPLAALPSGLVRRRLTLPLRMCALQLAVVYWRMLPGKGWADQSDRMPL